ncbi:STAS domain-containing protein [Streptomyces xanthochromogenes]|uniref:STAS domain-containing protein n=1 Tax=Streptomyces xanthochromogenes TaxID=67384 RepID=UPI001674B80E
MGRRSRPHRTEPVCPPSHHSPDPVTAQYARHGCWVVVACGEFDADTVEPLERALGRAAAEGFAVVVLDVGAVTFADSGLLNLLVRTQRATTLRIAGSPPQLRRILELTGADQALHLYPSADDACADAL